jgi:hypothetical protein
MFLRAVDPTVLQLFKNDSAFHGSEEIQLKKMTSAEDLGNTLHGTELKKGKERHDIAEENSRMQQGAGAVAAHAGAPHCHQDVEEPG